MCLRRRSPPPPPPPLGPTYVKLNGEQKSLSVDVDVVDGSSATQLQYSSGGGSTVGVSYMQALTPSLTLGGVGQYAMKKKALQTGIGGIYDQGEHMIAAQYATDNNVRASASPWCPD